MIEINHEADYLQGSVRVSFIRCLADRDIECALIDYFDESWEFRGGTILAGSAVEWRETLRRPLKLEGSSYPYTNVRLDHSPKIHGTIALETLIEAISLTARYE